MDHDMDRFRPDMSKFGHRPATPQAPQPRAAPESQAAPPPRSPVPGMPQQASPAPARPRRRATKAPVLLAVMVMLGIGASMVFRQLDEADLAELRSAAATATQAESVRQRAEDRVEEALAEAMKARKEAMEQARVAAQAAAARSAPAVEEAGDGDEQAPSDAQGAEGRVDEVVNRVVRRHSAAFRACYGRTLKTASPVLGARVVLRVTVAPSGAVTRASITDDTVGDPPTADCIVSRARAMRFPAREDPVTLTLPIVFAAGE